MTTTFTDGYPALVPALADTELYLCDNGACYCGQHAGMTARYTGKCRDGLPAIAVRPNVPPSQLAGYACEICALTLS